MSKLFIEDSTLSAIGDAIRAKNSTSDLLSPAEMVEAISNLSIGSDSVLCEREYVWSSYTTPSVSAGTTWTFDLSSRIGTEDNYYILVMLAGCAEGIDVNGAYYIAYSPITKAWKMLRYTNTTGTLKDYYTDATLSEGVLTVTFSDVVYPGNKDSATFTYYYLKPEGLIGIVPEGEIEITENGSHDVSHYASAIVNVLAESSGGGTIVYGGAFASGLSASTTSHTMDISSAVGTDDNVSFGILMSGGAGNNYVGMMLLLYDGNTKTFTKTDWYNGGTATNYIYGAFKSATISAGVITFTYSRAMSYIGARFTSWPVFYVEGGSGGGITPTGSITITENGTHDVTNYASAVVNVAASGSGTVNYMQKYPASVLDDGTKTFNLSETNGNFTVWVPTTATDGNHTQVLLFTNGAFVRGSFYSSDDGRLYGIDTTIKVNASYADGILTIAPSSTGLTVKGNYVIVDYIATE